MNNEELIDILKKATFAGVSDIHLNVGNPPVFRVDGKIMKTKLNVLTEQDIVDMIKLTAPENLAQKIVDGLDSDYPYEIENISRYRINVAMSLGTHAVSIRPVRYNIPSFEDLKLPDYLSDFIKYDNGLILVTGVTGSGKSTTIASMLELINMTRKKHIVTVEDPIEYIYKSKKSIFTQRQIGLDTSDFNAGIKYALRQDPDVILIGEIRDAESVRSALYAAETGHLVFATLHTFNSIQTINRVLSFFSPSERDVVRYQFAELFRGSISQKLIPHSSGKGRIPALEVLFNTATIKDFIIKNQPEEIYKLVQKGKYDHMVTFASYLYNLYKNGEITQEEALENADNKDELMRYMRGVY